MFTSNINPVLLDLGPVEIRYYGLVYILGFFLVYWALNRKRKELKITKKQAENFSILLLVGIVIGARLFSLIFPDPIGFLKDPLEFFRIWNGGMSFFGGLIGGFAVTYFY
ncbi:MAG: prolipoprotein diacylglyceryl transferase, partial [bacterium]|nr:prolipoprotein diacylglyceryl transferase [bacterium]